MQQIFQSHVLSGFRSTDSRRTRKCQRQNHRTTKLRNLRQTTILTTTAHNHQSQSEFRRKLIRSLHKLFVRCRYHDRHRTVQHRLQCRQSIVLLGQRQGRVRSNRCVSIPVPLSIQNGLASQCHGAHGTARITRTTRTTRQRQQQMLSRIAGQQRTSRIATCRRQDRAAATDHPRVRSDQSRHKALLPQRRSILRNRRLVRHRQLRCHLAVPVSSRPGQAIAGYRLLVIRINKARVNCTPRKCNLLSLRRNRQTRTNPDNLAVRYQDHRVLNRFFRRYPDRGARQRIHRGRLRLQRLSRQRCFVRTQQICLKNAAEQQ